MAGLLFSPDAGTDNAYLLVSDHDTFTDDDDDRTDYDEVIAWLTEVEANNAAFPVERDLRRRHRRSDQEGARGHAGRALRHLFLRRRIGRRPWSRAGPPLRAERSRARAAFPPTSPRSWPTGTRSRATTRKPARPTARSTPATARSTGWRNTPRPSSTRAAPRCRARSSRRCWAAARSSSWAATRTARCRAWSRAVSPPRPTARR